LRVSAAGGSLKGVEDVFERSHWILFSDERLTGGPVGGMLGVAYGYLLSRYKTARSATDSKALGE
jgi:hypothetical protein